MKTDGFQEPGSHERYYPCRQDARHLVAAPILYGHGQWSMAIFDRFQAHLCIFYCGDSPGRSKCTEAYAHLWICHSTGRVYGGIFDTLSLA